MIRFILPILLSYGVLIIDVQAQHRSSRDGFHVDQGKRNIPPVPDYSLQKSWAALPQMKDAADTVPQGLQDNQSTAQVDVFFIYPTTYLYVPKNSYKWNADIHDEKLNKRTDNTAIRYQATIFNGSCRVYAPRYRQAYITTFITLNHAAAKEALALAYSDVESAFLYYLQHYNQGRPFIIASHSQGTLHAQRLIKNIIEKDSDLTKKFICAYLIGMPIPKDSFNVIMPCTAADDLQCFNSWCTFQYGYYPAWYGISQKNACVINPLSWTADSTLAPSYTNKGAVLKNFRKIIPNVCDATVHRGMLWIHTPKIPLARTMSGGIYHVGDYNLFYMNIRENVEQRVKKYLSTSATSNK